jgi:hypothetical protein
MKTVKWGLVVVALFTGFSALADTNINCQRGEDVNANIDGCVPADISKEEIADLFKNAPKVQLEKESIQEQSEIGKFQKF